MLPRYKKACLTALNHFPVALLMSAGFTLSVCNAVFLDAPNVTLVLWCGLLCAVLCLVKAFFKRGLMIIMGLTALGLGLGAFNIGPAGVMVQSVKAAFLAVMGTSGALLPYRGALMGLVVMLSTLLAVIASDHDDILSSTILSLAIVLSSYLLYEGVLSVAYILPVALALLIEMSRVHTQRKNMLPAMALGAVVLAVAFALTPTPVDTDKTLANAAQKVRDFVEDYLVFNKTRAGFTLKSEGYLPLDDRLGGKAQPETHTVMQVQTDVTLRLRGVSYDYYDGVSWRDTVSSRRYLWQSASWQALRQEVFNMDKPRGSETEKTVRVRMLRDGTTTLFVPQRLMSVTPLGERMVPYFNAGSEIFLTRNLAQGDTYELTYLPLVARSENTEALIAQGAQTYDAQYEQIANAYLTLPEHIQSEVRDIAAIAAQGAQTPYGKALNIENYLASTYAYTLDVGDVPQNVDFVAWFLLREKKGYCTYFASALTVLCRLEGIPARYVTGFVAQPDESGVAVVTGENAHAWTEIYLNGFGWLPLDATPLRDRERNSNNDQSEGTPPDAPDTRPDPTPIPEPESSPEEEEIPPENEPTPSPAPSDAPEDVTPPETDPAPRPEEQPPNLWWLPVVLVLALIAAYIYLSQPERRAVRDRDAALSIYFTALMHLVAVQGFERASNETLHDFASRIARAFPDVQMEKLCADYAAYLYGRHVVVAQEPLAGAYRTLFGQLSPLKKLRLVMKNALQKPPKKRRVVRAKK